MPQNPENFLKTLKIPENHPKKTRKSQNFLKIPKIQKFPQNPPDIPTNTKKL